MYSVLNKMIFIIIIPILLFATSCNKPIKPEGILKENKLSEILADVHMAEASIPLFKATDKDSIAIGYYGHIFRVHEVEEVEFYASMKYYSTNSKTMADIYTKTEEILRKRGTESDAKAKKGTKVK
ncbi:MAG: hypothetical protein ACI94Y_000525 [Maribacter sp.]|jgi:hypothetical protein